MAVSLKALAVDVSLNADSYTAGAAKKVAADSAMISADDRRTASIAAARAAMEKATQTQLQNSAAIEAAAAPGAKVIALYEKQTAAITAMATQTGALNQTLAKQAAANDNAAASSSHVADGMRMAAKSAAEHAASSLAAAGKAAALTLVLGAVATILGTVYLAYKLVKMVVDLVTDAWELGNAKLAEFVALGQKATLVSTDFYQRITKAAEGAKLPVDALTESMKKLVDASAPKLGGSDIGNRIAELTKAGNFAGNTGVAQFANANGAEEKLRAMVSLTDQAFAKGERLAALDLTSKFLSPAAQEALTKDSEYLHRMLAAADKIAATELVSAADVGRATELQNRYDAASKILAERWHPLQGLLTDLGIKMKETWVSIVESVASAATWLERMATAVLRFPGNFWQAAKTNFANMTGIGEQFGPVYTDPKVFATSQLKAGLQNPNAVLQARDRTNDLSNALRLDTSFNPDKKKQIDDVKDALERATDSVEKYILVTNAAAKSVGAGVFEQEKAKVIAQLTAAALRDGKTDLEQYAGEWEKLANRAGAAGLALAQAKASSDAQFTLQTVFLDGTEKHIASIQRQLHGDDWKAWMNDGLATIIRVVGSLKPATNDNVKPAPTEEARPAQPEKVA